jgi:hypothetical protein
MVFVPHDLFDSDGPRKTTYDVGWVSVLYHDITAMASVPISKFMKRTEHERDS